MSKVSIKVLKDFEGSESGQDNDEWKKGEVYEVTEDFAATVVKGKLAELTKAKPAKPEAAEKGKDKEKGKKGKENPEDRETKTKEKAEK